MTEREILMRKLSTAEFAAADLELFLDTHPNNSEILEKADEYRERAEYLRKEYEKKFGSLTSDSDNTGKWQWIKAPWPWEIKKTEEEQ